MTLGKVIASSSVPSGSDGPAKWAALFRHTNPMQQALATHHLLSLEKSVEVLRVVLVGVFKECRLVLYMY